MTATAHSLQMPAATSVAEVLLARQRNGSQPGKRQDGRFVSLVIEGGAMRGVVSAGMVAALEHLGLRDSFDAVYGSSAGAVTGAYFVAGQARYGTTIFYENINNNRFIDVRRLLYGQSVVSLEFLLDDVCINQKPLAFQQVLNSNIPLYIVAACLSQKRSEALSDFEDQDELLNAMRASARIPFFAGAPVSFRGERFLDASLYESIPFKAAVKEPKTTDLVILLTRPSGDMRSKPGWADRHLVSPYLRRIDPELAKHYLRRSEEYKVEIQTIVEGSKTNSQPRMLPVQIVSDAPKIKPFEVSRSKLVCAAMHGFRATYAALGLTPPDLVEIITPFDSTQSSNREKQSR